MTKDMSINKENIDEIFNRNADRQNMEIRPSMNHTTNKEKELELEFRAKFEKLYVKDFLGHGSTMDMMWAWIRKTFLQPNPQQTNSREVDVEKLKEIEGFKGFNIDYSGIWYALFDTETSFWDFLSRNAISRSIEKPLNPIGRYSYRNSTKMSELVEWLLKEYGEYLSQKNKESSNKEGREDEEKLIMELKHKKSRKKKGQTQ